MIKLLNSKLLKENKLEPMSDIDKQAFAGLDPDKDAYQYTTEFGDILVGTYEDGTNVVEFYDYQNNPIGYTNNPNIDRLLKIGETLAGYLDSASKVNPEFINYNNMATKAGLDLWDY